MTTATEMAAAIGWHGDVMFDGMAVECIVEDARLSYGRLQYQITPATGRGSVWINADRFGRTP